MQKIWRFRQEHAVHLAAGRSRGLQNQKPSKKEKERFLCYQVDLNSDLGESFGAYTIGLDQDVIAHVSSANIACGYHAGDPLVMDRLWPPARPPAWR